ncbi:type II toxin-antitoxin system prevent-host-death family antitoxin [Rhizobium sp. XQZ8]|uniref:type II toxin-antitoxin system Phd/YefM family antitoxin n=1 Tax=Rhizobium populisoli TaxID=2859785 RepID=UPI001CA5F097|nr:type II toxin-antitoxin system prevent-host-death family antitoxin [Rhizobium populisoli]MBW6423353.1 type II toxin-antitoxin system prevent-host-death family antitoxin [Rhizobium populisoli]
MKTVNIHEAKTHLSRLVEDAAKGEGFVIAKAGKPMVKVVALEEAPAEEPKKKRRIGFLDGQFFIPEDLDKALDKEIEDLFYGEHK